MVKKETTIPLLLEIVFENINEAIFFLGDRGIDDFLKDRKTIRACERNLEIIGDACNEILKRREKENFQLNEINIILFKTVYSSRNFLSHGYDTPDSKALYYIIVDDLPDFRELIKKIRNEIQ